MVCFISGVLRSVFFHPQCKSHKGRVERGGGGELLVAKLLIAKISNKVTGMLDKFELLKLTLLKVPGETAWNMFKTWVKPVLLYIVDRAEEFDYTLSFKNSSCMPSRNINCAFLPSYFSE